MVTFIIAIVCLSVGALIGSILTDKSWEATAEWATPVKSGNRKRYFVIEENDKIKYELLASWFKE